MEKAIASEREFRISELSMLRVLASAGTSVLIFDHSLRAMAGQLLDVVDSLREYTTDLSEERGHEFEKTLRRLEAWSSMTTGQASLVGLLLGSQARTRSDSLAVHPLVESLKEGFRGYTSRFGIQFRQQNSSICANASPVSGGTLRRTTEYPYEFLQGCPGKVRPAGLCRSYGDSSDVDISDSRYGCRRSCRG